MAESKDKRKFYFITYKMFLKGLSDVLIGHTVVDKHPCDWIEDHIGENRVEVLFAMEATEKQFNREWIGDDI